MHYFVYNKSHTNYHSYAFRHPLFYRLSLFIYIQYILTKIKKQLNRMLKNSNTHTYIQGVPGGM